MEDWAEICQLRRAEGMPIKQVARVMGVSKNTVKRALVADGPPKYERAPGGSIVDPVEARIRELLATWPTMPATVIAERIGWTRGLTVLKDRVRELRPAYLPPDPASRTAYAAGEVAQCDLWFPDITLPVGFGQVRTATRLPVLVMVSGYARRLAARLLPSRCGEDLFAGWWQLIGGLGAAPRVLVWDGEGAVGQRRRRQTVERANGYLETSFCPAGCSAPRRTSTPSSTTGSRWPTGGTAWRWGAPRPIGSTPTARRCCPCHRWNRSPGGAARCGCRATTTSAWTPTTTGSTRPRSAAGSRSALIWTGSG